MTPHHWLSQSRTVDESVKIPAPEWGRLAVSLPGWRWMPGMQPWFGSASDPDGERSIDRVFCPETWQGSRAWPDPDDPATAGCFESLFGGPVAAYVVVMAAPVAARLWHQGHAGRARIAAAAALGRWPGGEG